VAEHRPYLMVWEKASVAVRPEVLRKEDDPKPIGEIPLARNESLTLALTAALIKDAPAEWIFWPSGTCEPATVKFAGREGTWTARYSPLTARAELDHYAPQ
jgi:hypothetical protein